MILPGGPLRLRGAFVRERWARVATALAPALAVLAVVTVWQGRAARSLWLDQRAWARGTPVAVLDAEREVRSIALVARHVRVAATIHAGGPLERTVHDDYFAFFEDGIQTDVPAARVDPDGRVTLSWGIRAAPFRWAMIAFVVGMLGFLALALSIGAFRALATLRAARAAARSGKEIELPVVELVTHDVHGQPAYLEVRFRGPPPASSPAGYRDAARAPWGEIASERFRLDGPGPLLLDDATKVLAMRAGGSDRAVLIREDFGPLDLSAAEAAAARARLGDRAAQPPSAVPASDESPPSPADPPSGIGTQTPSSSKT